MNTSIQNLALEQNITEDVIVTAFRQFPSLWNNTDVLKMLSIIDFNFPDNTDLYDDGYKSGEDAGYDDGHETGYATGFSEGKEEGRDAGYEEGYAAAKKEFEKVD